MSSQDPEAAEPQRPFRVLRSVSTPQARGEVIGKVASSVWCVDERTNVLDVADDLNQSVDIYALGVVDASTRVVGLVARRELFGLLGRPYGRDVLRHQAIKTVCQEARVFYFDTNLFAAAEEIDRIREESGNQNFALVGSDEEFCGVFTSRDLLEYLSGVTRRDIELARTIQMRIVKEFEHFSGDRFDVLCSSFMAKGVGGDFYTAVRYGGSRQLVCIGDVSGKGVAASLVTSVLHGIIHTFDLRLGLFPLIKSLNEFLLGTFQQDKYLTGIFVDIDQATGVAEVCDLGHGYGFVYSAGRLRRLVGGTENLPIGVTGDLSPTSFRYRLAPDDMLLLFTDGLFEQRNLRGEVFSIATVERLLRAYSGLGLESFRVKLFESFHHFRAAAPLQDDITVVLVKQAGAAAPLHEPGNSGIRSSPRS